MDDVASEILQATRSAHHESTLAYELRQAQRLGDASNVGETEASGAVGPWFITPHAVRRYIKRVARGLSYNRALATLIHEGTQARFVKVAPYPSATGQPVELWRGKRPLRLRFYVTHNPSLPRPSLITVMKGPCP